MNYIRSSGLVLVADADKKTRSHLAKFLSRKNLTIETASTGSEVIQKVQNTQVKVLIMDLELGGIKGYEIIPILKKIDPTLPIIVTSGNSSLEVARRVRAEGVFFYALKPLDMEEIELAVNDALKKQKNEVKK
ncbi:response regulator [Candidatus Aerophobetes bacterium]|nr:response regulator [Candidatus Aerophobetes bacterium]